MQTYAYSPLPKNVKFLLTLTMCMSFSMIFVSATCAQNVYKIPDEDVKLTFNGKTIDQKKGIHHAAFNIEDENKLLIELKSKIFAPNQNVNLKVILARGNRPISAKDLINFPENTEIDLTNLLLQAKPGDRIVFAFDNRHIMNIPIS